MNTAPIHVRQLRARWLVVFVLAISVWQLAQGADLVEAQIFQSGGEGYHTFRIPAIVRATNGTLLAFAEGRKNSASDTGDIDLVVKLSLDDGRTWQPLQIVADDGLNTAGNPTPIVDMTTGKILLLTTHNGGKVTETQVREGRVKDRRVFMQESIDNGITWSAPKEITSQTKQDNWRCYATGPVHGIQLARGPHAGRLIAPGDHTTTDSTTWSACGAHLLFSDDHGTTWHIGADDSPNNGIINPNECTAIELIDGRIFTLARNQNGTDPGHRAFAYSSDAGASFDTPFAVNASLVSPIVQGSLMRYSAVDQGDTRNRILFSAPRAPSQRKEMTIRSSFDETRTWDEGKVIYAGPSAYSDMVKLPGAKIGLLYESGIKQPYERITFAILGADLLDARERHH